jgi:hypothetical protein
LLRMTRVSFVVGSVVVGSVVGAVVAAIHY